MADDVSGCVLSLMSIDVLGGRYLEVVGSKMLYGLVIEAIVFAVLGWKLLFVGLEVWKWLQIEFVFLKQVMFKLNSVHAAMLYLVAAKGVP